MSEKLSIRWGIVTTGLIASWFVEDLMLDRPDAPVNHVIQCIGGSDIEKCKAFKEKYCPHQPAKLYGSYEEVYSNPEVDVVYIGTPHAFHKKNMLDAIAAGKNILCEKAFTINASEAKEVFEAARRQNVYVHEAMWLRHRPLVHKLRKLLHEDKIVGEPFRMYSEYGKEIDISTKPPTSRYKNLSLGAGSLLDLGIYALTWAILTLDAGSPSNSERPLALATQTHQEGIEVTTSVLLQYPSTGRQGIVTSTTMGNGDPNIIAKIYGTNGFIEVEGPGASHPQSFTVYSKATGDADDGSLTKPTAKNYDFPKTGRGFIYEADNTAMDILQGRKESSIMPWSETVQVMEIMDSIRKQGDTFYPDHDEIL